MTIFTITGIYLAICSYTDIKYKKINILLSVAAGLTGFVTSVCSLSGFDFFKLNICGTVINASFFTEHTSLFSIVVSLFICTLMLLISLLTKGAIGTGDCIMTAVLACFMMPYHLIAILLYGFFLSGLAALFLLIIKKYSRNDTLFFAPFLLIGHICYFAFM